MPVTGAGGRRREHRETNLQKPRFNNPVSNGACEKIKCSAKCDSCKINDLIAKLCAYEDTGLEPEEIKEFAEDVAYQFGYYFPIKDKLHTDSSEYKMYGNGIALP